MSKYSDIWAMIGKLDSGGTDPEEIKSILCESISGGRTTGLRELTPAELKQLREDLRKKTGSHPKKGDKSRKRKRSAVLKLLTDYGIDTRDWDAINTFVSEKRIAGKEFALLDNEELEALRRKLHAILRKRSTEPAHEPERPRHTRTLTLYYPDSSSNSVMYN